jgi:hypothetical protein
MQKIAFLSLKEQENLYFEAFRHLNRGSEITIAGDFFVYLLYSVLRTA